MEPAVVDRPEVNLSLLGPQPQRRATVAFRLILAVPHLLYLYVLQMLGAIVVLIAWFAALFTGRIPEGIGDLLRNIVRYSLRVNAYTYLLTDKYPPFSLGDVDYPVSVDLPPPTTLNRAAVLFRIGLAIPVLFMITVVGQGLLLPVLVIWLIVLVSARMPSSAFEAAASYLRYQTRFYAWFLLLTPEYPRGLFGDRTPPATAAASTSSLPPPPPPPTTGRWGTPRITRLVLSRGAKWLLGVMVALGVLFLVGNIVIFSIIASRTTESQRQLRREYAVVRTGEVTRRTSVQTCATTGGGLACVQAADRALATRVTAFGDQIERHVYQYDYPDGAIDDATIVRDDARKLATVLDQMATTSDQTQHDYVLERVYQTHVRRLHDDEVVLDDELWLDD